jgi:hypothetical protein
MACRSPPRPPRQIFVAPTANPRPSRLARGRDAGDCSGIFAESGSDVFGECDRSVCPVWLQDSADLARLRQTCQTPCFRASCDWSHSMCSTERASLAACPLFDAAVLQSISKARANRTLNFVMGGTARCAHMACAMETNGD